MVLRPARKSGDLTGKRWRGELPQVGDERRTEARARRGSFPRVADYSGILRRTFGGDRLRRGLRTFRGVPRCSALVNHSAKL